MRGAADDTLEVEDTEWGPILARDVDGTPLALEWSAQQPGALDLTLRAMAEADAATLEALIDDLETGALSWDEDKH